MTVLLIALFAVATSALVLADVTEQARRLDSIDNRLDALESYWAADVERTQP